MFEEKSSRFVSIILCSNSENSKHDVIYFIEWFLYDEENSLRGTEVCSCMYINSTDPFLAFWIFGIFVFEKKK